jgi:hypothetical protein
MAETDSLRPGTPVAVKNSYTGSWSEGFVIDCRDASADRYRIRRLSDNSVLPAAFPPEVIRSS